MIGDVGFAGERDGHDLLRLIVIERLEDEAMEVFDVDGSAALAGGGLSGMFGQGVSWRTVARRDRATSAASGVRRYQLGSAREWRLRTSGRAAGEGK